MLLKIYNTDRRAYDKHLEEKRLLVIQVPFTPTLVAHYCSYVCTSRYSKLAQHEGKPEREGTRETEDKGKEYPMAGLEMEPRLLSCRLVLSYKLMSPIST